MTGQSSARKWMEDFRRRAAWAIVAGSCPEQNCGSMVGEECWGGLGTTHMSRIMQYVPLVVYPQCNPNDEVVPEGEPIRDCVMVHGHTDLHLAPNGDRWGLKARSMGCSEYTDEALRDELRQRAAQDLAAFDASVKQHDDDQEGC